MPLIDELSPEEFAVLLVIIRERQAKDLERAEWRAKKPERDRRDAEFNKW